MFRAVSLHSKIAALEVAMSKVRKALLAALGAGLSAAVTALVSGKGLNSAAVGTIIGAMVVAGWAVWRVPNAPAAK